jgi:hypothetical protein
MLTDTARMRAARSRRPAAPGRLILEGDAALLPPENPADTHLPGRRSNRPGNSGLGSDHPLGCPCPGNPGRDRGGSRVRPTAPTHDRLHSAQTDRTPGSGRSCLQAQHRDRSGPAGRHLQPLLLRRPGVSHPPGGWRIHLRLDSVRWPPVPAAQSTDRGVDRLDWKHPAHGAAAPRPAPPGRARICCPSHCPPRDGDRSRACPVPGDRGWLTRCEIRSPPFAWQSRS